MNLLERHADQLYKELFDPSNFYTRPDLSINLIRSKLIGYHKFSHRAIILERIRLLAKIEFTEHEKTCKLLTSCSRHNFFQDLVYFINEEIENNSIHISDNEFSNEERILMNQFNENVTLHLRSLSIGQEIIYEDLYRHLDEIKSHMYLSKDNWVQLLSGKLLEMVTGGVIEEMTANSIIKFANQHISNLITE